MIFFITYTYTSGENDTETLITEQANRANAQAWAEYMNPNPNLTLLNIDIKPM